MDVAMVNALQSVIIVSYAARDVACAKPETYRELEDLCRKEFAIPDDSKLVFTTTDLSVSLGRSVELHRGQTSWAAMRGLVQRVTLELHDDKFKISIACNLQSSSPPGVLQFQTRSSQLIASVLGGACAAFGVNKHGARLVLLRLERVDEAGTMAEKRYICSPSATVIDSGIQPGSRLSIEPDPDAPPPPAPEKVVSEGQMYDKQTSPGHAQDKQITPGQLFDRQISPGQMYDRQMSSGQVGGGQRSPGHPPDRHMSAGQVYDRQMSAQHMHDRRVTDPADGRIGGR